MNEEGIVFDIQGFSIHDGPGIRTLVFFKGCPLRCPWCSNPESQRFEPELFFHPERCIGCQKCLQVCPRGAIGITDGKISFNRDRCQNCGQCSSVCYAEARVMKGRQMRADEVVEEVLKDSLFYINSGGGVTLGGGEPLAQADFAAAILKRCKMKGLHTAVETAGHVPWLEMEKVLSYTDLFLYDVKHMDSDKHSKMIGVDNQLILANLGRLVGANKQVVVCTPLIPGFTDTIRQIRAIARYIARMGIRQVHLLPYHRFGAGKNRLLGRIYPFQGKKELTNRKKEVLERSAASEGLRVKCGG